MVRSGVSTVDVFASNGTAVATYQGYDEATWLDSDQLVLSRWTRGEGGSINYTRMGYPEATSFLVSLDSADIQPLADNLAGGKSNGHGLIAVDRCLQCNTADEWHEAVASALWTPKDGLASLTAGNAAAWSRNDDRLLVEHPLGDGPGRRSTWEVVAVPSLQRIARGGGVLDVDFEWAARWTWPQFGPPTDAHLVDLATGREQPIDFDFSSAVAVWDATPQLIVVDFREGDGVAYALDGSISARWSELGNEVFASAGHTVIGFWNDEQDEPQTIKILRAGEMQRVRTPGPLSGGAYAAHLSPDGSMLVVVCDSGRGLETAYLTILD